ncbi:hypothetical protein J3E72DRAFT_139 [Bipolaris maydis]|nr:hypothetical protein J3E74DRAFT_51273 [Bipolaris maydis]KAJ6202275.1 hypothetical protein J3E72DRAFT_139 [Bipolaris maydis]KAJ6208653.1 hypothetical protein PSV09DRAFT_2040732 [Bipolaris maydis]
MHVERVWASTSVYPFGRTVLLPVTIKNAVFEDVLCPYYNAFRHQSNGSEAATKTSLRESCNYKQREASWHSNQRRSSQQKAVSWPLCCSIRVL